MLPHGLNHPVPFQPVPCIIHPDFSPPITDVFDMGVVLKGKALVAQPLHPPDIGHGRGAGMPVLKCPEYAVVAVEYPSYGILMRPCVVNSWHF